jgi:hypothetical protein
MTEIELLQNFRVVLFSLARPRLSGVMKSLRTWDELLQKGGEMASNI